MEAFEEILIKYNCSRRPQPPASTIEEIEDAVGFKLPKDYKIYLPNYQPFMDFIGKKYIDLEGIEGLIEMNRTCLIFDNLSNTLGIGGNGSSELIALEKLDSDNYRIVLTPFIDLDKQYHIEIGHSFSDFLIRFDSGRRWFDK